MKKQIEFIISRINEVNNIICTCSDGIMPIGQAYVIG